MRAGMLRERVTIQVPTPSTDPEWGQVEQYGVVATVAASVIPTGGSESARDKGVQSSTGYTIRIRYLDNVDSKCVLIWRGRTLDIVSAIDPDNRRRELVIEAKEHESNG